MFQKLALIGVLLTAGTFEAALTKLQLPAGTQATSADQNQTVQVQISQPPRVENVTPNSATIAWSTNVQAGTRLIYGTDPVRLTLSASAPWGGVTHRVYLANLRPDTTYYFQAFSEHASGSGTSVQSDIRQFTTPRQ